MAYSKQTWSSNELITADKLNHIEDGIPTKTSQLTNDSGFLTSHKRAFSNILVTGTGASQRIKADTYTDTLTITAGSNITLTPDTENKKLTINTYLEVLIIDIPSFSSLPITRTSSDIAACANIDNDMVCLKAELGNPSAQTSDWTVSTSSGQVTITGSINGSTTLKLYLMKSQ